MYILVHTYKETNIHTCIKTDINLQIAIYVYIQGCRTNEGFDLLYIKIFDINVSHPLILVYFGLSIFKADNGKNSNYGIDRKRK